MKIYSILLLLGISLICCSKLDNNKLGTNNSLDPGTLTPEQPTDNTGGTGFLHTHNTLILDGTNNEILLRGIGLGGWMLQEPYMLQANSMKNQTDIRNHITDLIGEEKTQEFYDSYLENGIQKSDVQQLKAWGFNSIRIPLHYNLFTLAVEDEPVQGENTWLDKGFTLLDKIVQWCADEQMYAILDLHAAPGGQGNDIPISDRDATKPLLWQSQANMDKTIALWGKLAGRYKDEKWVGGYDLINETNVNFNNLSDKNAHDGGDNQLLWQLMQQITSAIRQVDNNHIIILEGNGWANNYTGFPGPWDDNMVISFHKYQYQGDKGNTEDEIRSKLDLRDQYNIPLWCGEFGENNDGWIAGAVSLFERNNIGWSFWPLKKIGTSNPFEVVKPSGYQGILNYWQRGGTKPSADDAFQIFMNLAQNYKTDNLIKHEDVVNALIK